MRTFYKHGLPSEEFYKLEYYGNEDKHGLNLFIQMQREVKNRTWNKKTCFQYVYLLCFFLLIRSFCFCFFPLAEGS